LGPSYSTAEVERVLQEFGLTYSRPADLADAVAQAIAANKVVGWFDGRAEFGARALGARSVLANPRNEGAKARLNHLLKKRDWFMPFAPSILEEHGRHYFEDFAPSPYMNTAFKSYPHRRTELGAAVHVDGTVRAHTVDRSTNPRYRAVIEAFYRICGVPLILNTSFNKHGLPMVATPRQAVQHLLEGCVDALAIEGFLVEGAPVPVEHPAPTESDMIGLMFVRHAAKLVMRGRSDQAAAFLSKAAPELQASDRGFTSGEDLVWESHWPLERLDDWWLSTHAAAAREQ